MRTHAAALLSFLSIGVLIPALPRYISGPLGAGAVAVGIALAVPSVTGALSRPLAGRVADRRGRRTAVLMGAASLVLGTEGLARADSLPLLLVCRAVAGVGEAFTYVGLGAAASDHGQRAINHFSVAVSVGLLAGPPIGEFTRSTWGFAAVWQLSAVTAAGMLLVGAGGRVAESPEAAGRAGRARDGKSGRGAVGGRGPLIHRAGLVPGLAYWASVWGYTAVSAFLPLYMADPGAGYLVYGVVLLAVRLGGHSLISRAAPRGTACLSLVMTATGFAGFTFWPSVVMIVVISAGQALGLPAFLAMATEGLPADQRGSVVATVTAFFDIGFLTAALALGAVVQAVGLRYGFAAAGAMAALGLLLFIPNARRSSP